MENFVEILNHVKKAEVIRHMSTDELQEARLLLNSLADDIESRIADISTQNDDESDYIEIEIDGKPDLIKKNIKVLNISCNNFTTLPLPIYNLKNLKKLYLYSNNFSNSEKQTIRKRFPSSVQIYF